MIKERSRIIENQNSQRQSKKASSISLGKTDRSNNMGRGCAGNRYMERIQEEMVKMSQDERDRYLYLREEMAASDRVSQLQSAENRGVRAGKLLNQISMIQKKVKKNKNLEQIADELEESASKIRPIYDQVKQHPDKTAEEIYNLINNE